jgi:hypothetical protein
MIHEFSGLMLLNTEPSLISILEYIVCDKVHRTGLWWWFVQAGTVERPSAVSRWKISNIHSYQMGFIIFCNVYGSYTCCCLRKMRFNEQIVICYFLRKELSICDFAGKDHWQSIGNDRVWFSSRKSCPWSTASIRKSDRNWERSILSQRTCDANYPDQSSGRVITVHFSGTVDLSFRTSQKHGL